MDIDMDTDIQSKASAKRFVDAINEIAEKKSPSILDLLRIIMSHCSEDIKSVKLIGETCKSIDTVEEIQ